MNRINCVKIKKNLLTQTITTFSFLLCCNRLKFAPLKRHYEEGTTEVISSIQVHIKRLPQPRLGA